MGSQAMARVRGDSKGMGRDNQTVSVLITTILKFCFPSCIDLILLYTPCKIVSFFSTDEWLLKKNQYTTLNIKNTFSNKWPQSYSSHLFSCSSPAAGVCHPAHLTTPRGHRGALGTMGTLLMQSRLLFSEQLLNRGII